MRVSEEQGERKRNTKCTVMQVGCNCQHHMCHKHCHAVGGCLSSSHSPDGSQPSSMSLGPATSSNIHTYPAPSVPLLPMLHRAEACSLASNPPLPSLDSAPSLSQIDPCLHPHISEAPSAPLLVLLNNSSLSTFSESIYTPRTSSPPPVSSSSSTSLPASHSDSEQGLQEPLPPQSFMADPSIKPQHVSQLCPVFVQRVADVHQRAERKRRCDQESIQDKKKVLESITVFSFFKV